MNAKTKGEAEQNKPRMRRLFKGKRSLPAVEWIAGSGGNPGKTKFQFTRGVFDTTDNALADELVRRGYTEVDPNQSQFYAPEPEQAPDPDEIPIPAYRVPVGSGLEPAAE